MTRLLRSLAFSSALVLLPIFSGAQTSQVRIGAVASLTGPAGEQGKNWVQGAELALSELKASGVNIRLIVEDDATQPAKSVSAFHKLAGIDKVQGIIGGTWDFLAEAVYGLAASYQVPFVTPTNPKEILAETAADNPWVFSNALPLTSEKDAIAKYIAAEKIGSISLFYPNVPWGVLHADLMKSLSKELNFKILDSYEFPIEGGYTDSIRLFALKLSKERPDLVYAVVDYNGLDLLMSEFERLKTRVKVLTTQHLDQAMKFSKDPMKFEGVFGVYPRAIGDKEFQKRFKEKFGAEPRVYAAEGYDAFMFLAKALLANVIFNVSNERFTYAGITGLHQLPAADHALVNSKAVIMTSLAGVFEPWRGN